MLSHPFGPDPSHLLGSHSRSFEIKSFASSEKSGFN